ncbi:MAG: hypothetical protein JSV66_06050 [Trueperaceae bacterium]|nr:MAG: hypothetical protein JSV66_06050 [Trueperaceae bacterium]
MTRRVLKTEATPTMDAEGLFPVTDTPGAFTLIATKGNLGVFFAGVRSNR